MRDELNWKVLVGIVALFVVVTVMFSNCTGSNYDEITADQYAEVVKLSEACPSVLAISKNLMEVGRIVKKDYEKTRFQVQSATPSPWVLASSKKTS